MVDANNRSVVLLTCSSQIGCDLCCVAQLLGAIDLSNKLLPTMTMMLALEVDQQLLVLNVSDWLVCYLVSAIRQRAEDMRESLKLLLRPIPLLREANWVKIVGNTDMAVTLRNRANASVISLSN